MTDKKVTYVLPTWADVEGWAKGACDAAKQQGYRPDVIVGLSRGGLVPARLFCDYLHVKNCVSIKVDHWGLTATPDGQARVTQGLDLDLNGRKVLIVDDITDTGKSMQVAIEHIGRRSPMANIKTATLLHIKGGAYEPDFYGAEKDWAWFIFPWNVREDLVNIIRKIQQGKQLDAQGLHAVLRDEHQIPLGERELSDILAHMTYVDSR